MCGAFPSRPGGHANLARQLAWVEATSSNASCHISQCTCRFWHWTSPMVLGLFNQQTVSSRPPLKEEQNWAHARDEAGYRYARARCRVLSGFANLPSFFLPSFFGLLKPRGYRHDTLPSLNRVTSHEKKNRAIKARTCRAMSLTAGLDLCLFPAGTPPDGQLSNFENPPTYAPTVIAVSVVVLFFATLFTGCRLLANWKKLTWGDCTPLAQLNNYSVLAHMSNKI